LWIQGIYTALTALWPIVDLHSFMLVSGYKFDRWLVKTVSLLLLAIAVCMLLAACQKNENFPVGVLSLFTSVSLAYVDFFYALSDTIPNIYMVDGLAEIVFTALWLYILVGKRWAISDTVDS
jgi:hypothetical protein